MQPQVFFLLDRVKQLAANDASMKERQPFKALLDHDLKALHELGKQGVMELAFATHAGITEEAFDAIEKAWFASARHPKFARPFQELTYGPQVELLDYLRANGFKTYIVSGGDIDLIHTFAEEAYGIPREQVIGSSARLRYELQNGRAV